MFDIAYEQDPYVEIKCSRCRFLITLVHNHKPDQLEDDDLSPSDILQELKQLVTA